MDDTLYNCIVAAVRLINCAGDSSSRRYAENLVSLADKVASATVVAGVDAPRTNLVAAATELELALRDTTARNTAVAVLRKAAVDLECAIGAEIGVVRDAAAELASLLHERQDEQMRTAKKIAQSGRWWSLIWGRKQTRTEHAARIKQLENSAHSFMTSVAKLGALHDHDEIVGVVSALEEAVNALQYGGFSNSQLIINAAKVATDVERKLGDYIIALRDPAATLVRECQKHMDFQEAMVALLRAHTEETQRREQAKRSDTWWSFRWLHRHFDKIQEAILVRNEQQLVAGPRQGGGRYAIFGFIKALGTSVKEKLKLFNHDECIFMVISLCYTLVVVHVPFSSYLRSIWEVCYASVTSFMSMLGCLGREKN